MGLEILHPGVEDEDAVIDLIVSAMATYTDWCPGFRAPADGPRRERARLRTAGSEVTWLLARRDERIIGVSRWVLGDPATLSLLMVAPSSWGSGVGSALHDRALSEMTMAGLGDARLTVPLGNLRARRFYRRLGWRQTSAPPTTHTWLGLQMLEYARALDHVPDDYERSARRG